MNIHFTQNNLPYIVRLADDSSVEAADNAELNLPSELVFEISYPTREPVVQTFVNEGWTVWSILRSFQLFYERIYAEEDTASPEGGYIEMDCSECKNPLLELYENNYHFERFNRDTCCICMSDRQSSKIVLKCQHKFHFVCLKKWFKNSNSCPLCKKPIKKCSYCNSERIIKIVIANNTMRLLSGEPRLPTNGIYGIGNVHYEEITATGALYEEGKITLTFS